MSRLGDALASSTREPYADLTSFATRLAGRLGDCQYGGPTTVRIAATVPYLEEVPANARGTSKTSLEHLNLLVTATVEGRRPPDVRAGVRVDHIVACPCVQQTYKHALMSQRRQLDAHDVSPYALTHSQRCTTTLMARGFDGAFPATNVLRALDAVIVRCMNTLPRAAELAMVFRAHRQPQFIEDALRESLWAFYRGLGAPSSVRVVHGYAKSSESIHEFDLFAKGRLVPGRSAVLERAIHQRERGDHVSND